MSFSTLVLTARPEQVLRPALGLVDQILPSVPLVGVYDDGLVSVLDEETGIDLLSSWEWLLGKGVVALVTTGFGDVFFWSDGAVKWLDVQRGHIEHIDGEVPWFLDSFLLNPDVTQNILKVEWLDALARRHRPLAFEEAFVLKPWPLLGGTSNFDHYEIRHCGIYVDLVGQTFPQLGGPTARPRP